MGLLNRIEGFSDQYRICSHHAAGLWHVIHPGMIASSCHSHASHLVMWLVALIEAASQDSLRVTAAVNKTAATQIIANCFWTI